MKLIRVSALLFAVSMWFGAAWAASPKLASLTCAQATVPSGGTLTCTGTLTAAATGKTWVDLQFSDSALNGPDDLILNAGQVSGQFTAIAGTVKSNRSVKVTAILGTSKSVTVVVTPGGGPPPPPPPQLSTLVCGSASITGAGTVACEVGVSAAETTATAIALSSSSASLTVPASVTVPVGTSNATFNAVAQAVTTTTTATLTASLAGSTAKTTITLNPAVGPPTPTLKSLACSQPSMTGAGPDTCTVTLTSAATASTTVSLTSSSASLTVPASVTVPSGSASATFAATAAAVAASTTVTLTATLNATAQTAVIILNPAAPPKTYSVNLTWAAPTLSPDAVVSYNIYRALSGSTGTYQKLNTAVNVPTTYSDKTAQSATTYLYEVKSVDAAGVESAPSNAYSAAIP